MDKATHPPAQASDEPMRAAFEAWFSQEGSWPNAITRNGSGYRLSTAQSSWTAWQACWQAATPRATADVEGNLRAELIDAGALRQYCHNDGSAGFVMAYDADITNRFLAALKAQPAPTEAQGEDSARLDVADLATIEEATKVLESAAKHNEGLGRTVFAHVQRDRAVRLRAIIDRARASSETGGVKS